MAMIASSAIAAIYTLNKVLDDLPRSIVVRCLEYLRDLVPHKGDILHKKDIENLTPEQLEIVVDRVKVFARDQLDQVE